MSKRDRLRWEARNDLRFVETEYVIDATEDETLALWWRWSEHHRVPWAQDGRSYMAQIGEVAKRPIVVSVDWNIVGHSRVAFVRMTSQLADFKMMEEWQQAVFPCMALSERHANAANFGNILSHIEKRHGMELKLADSVYRFERFLDIDHDLPRPGADPQQALEWCERKGAQWLERAEYWRTKAREALPNP